MGILFGQHMDNSHEIKVNDVFPTDPSFEHFWHRAKASLPITDTNELFALLCIHQNTIINQLAMKDTST